MPGGRICCEDGDFFCKLLRFVHCSNLGGDFKLLIVRVFGISLDLGDALNTLSGFGGLT